MNIEAIGLIKVPKQFLLQPASAEQTWRQQCLQMAQVVTITDAVPAYGPNIVSQMVAAEIGIDGCSRTVTRLFRHALYHRGKGRAITNFYSECKLGRQNSLTAAMTKLKQRRFVIFTGETYVPPADVHPDRQHRFGVYVPIQPRNWLSEADSKKSKNRLIPFRCWAQCVVGSTIEMTEMFGSETQLLHSSHLKSLFNKGFWDRACARIVRLEEDGKRTIRKFKVK